jgi:hypothetical protein
MTTLEDVRRKMKEALLKQGAVVSAGMLAGHALGLDVKTAEALVENALDEVSGGDLEDHEVERAFREAYPDLQFPKDKA